MAGQPQVIFPKSRTARRIYSAVPGLGGIGTVSRDDGIEEVYYETAIDLKELEALARRAADNKSGKARDGALTVRVIERRMLPKA